MNEGNSLNKMADSNNVNSSQRRRSARLSSPQADVKTNNMAAVKRSITVRKIAPRKTVAPSEHNKENTPRRRSGSEASGQVKKPKVSTPEASSLQKKPKVSTPEASSLQKRPKVSTPAPVPGRRSSSSAKKKNEAAVTSPILPSSPPPPSCPEQPASDPRDAVWSQKVRRSYSRLSDKSLHSPDSRETLFGFEDLKTPEVVRSVGKSKTGLEVSGSLSGLNSFTSLLEAEDCGSAVPEPDTNIPGVAVVKEKRRRKKVQQIDATELDVMAARMNAEFEEAEVFELVVE